MVRVGARRPFKWCKDQNGIEANEGVPIAKNKSKVHGTKSSNEEYDKLCQQERRADGSKSPEHWREDSLTKKYRNKNSPKP